MKHNHKHCCDCPHAFACRVHRVVPALGRCSFQWKELRNHLVGKIRDAVRKGNGSAVLGHSVTVELTDVGFTVGHDVRRVRLIPGSDPGTGTAFDIGGGCTTDQLDEHGLSLILNALKP